MTHSILLQHRTVAVWSALKASTFSGAVTRDLTFEDLILLLVDFALMLGGISMTLNFDVQGISTKLHFKMVLEVFLAPTASKGPSPLLRALWKSSKHVLSVFGSKFANVIVTCLQIMQPQCCVL